MNNHALTGAVVFLTAMVYSSAAVAAKPPPNINQCKSKWVITASTMDFGSFAASGSGNITMSPTGARTATGLIDLSNGLPVTPLTVTIDNSKGASCGSYGVTLSWNPAPSTITGPGTAMSLSNVLVTHPLVPPLTALPVTVTPASLPYTFSFQAVLGVNAPQAIGAYTGTFGLDLTQAGTTISATVTSTANVFASLGISETSPMNFGTVAGDGSLAGSVILDPTGARSVTGGATAFASGPGSAGNFQISGEDNQAYTLTYSATATLENAAGQQITADNFNDNSLGTIPVGGIENFQVGATLNLGIGQAAGNYSTSTGAGSAYSITVNYN